MEIKTGYLATITGRVEVGRVAAVETEAGLYCLVKIEFEDGAQWVPRDMVRTCKPNHSRTRDGIMLYQSGIPTHNIPDLEGIQ